MLLLKYGTDYLALELGAYVDACKQDLGPGTAQLDWQRAPDGFTLFRSDEFGWDHTRPLSLEGETHSSIANNKWTGQVSINSIKNFCGRFWGNIFIAYELDMDALKDIRDELPDRLRERTFILKAKEETGNHEVSWEVPPPIQRKKIDLNPPTSDTNSGA